MKKIIIITMFVLLILIFIGILIVVLNNNNNKFKLDSENKYIVTTDKKYMTMENDGGTFKSSYYEIDLKQNTISQFEDSYNGKLGTKQGYVYKGKLLNTKKIDANTSEKLKLLLDKIIAIGYKDIGEYYTVSNNISSDIVILNKLDVEEFNQLIEK